MLSRLQLPPGPWTTVFEGVCERFPNVNREIWRARFELGKVMDSEGIAIGISAPYCVGQEILYAREVEDETPIPFEIELLFQDEHLLVVDKPHFLPVMPAGRFVQETVLARLIKATGNTQLVPLHRIDRETAGLVLFSARPETRGIYQALFRERKIQKGYEAIAPALPDLSFPMIRRSCIERGEPFFRMQEIEGEPNSETRINVVERGDPQWRYTLEPVTGRKHQLRVHMAALGAAIENDRLYPSATTHENDDYSKPLKLLAKRLEFTDPLSGQSRVFESRRGLHFD